MFTPKQYVDMIMEPRELERLIDEALRNGLLTVCLGQYRSEVAINTVLALYESAGWKLRLNRSGLVQIAPEHERPTGSDIAILAGSGKCYTRATYSWTPDS